MATNYIPLSSRLSLSELGFDLRLEVDAQVHSEAAVDRPDEPRRDARYQLEAVWLYVGETGKINLLSRMNNTEQEILLTYAIRQIKQRHLDALITRSERNSEFGD